MTLTFFTVFEPASMILDPVATLPVNASLATSNRYISVMLTVLIMKGVRSYQDGSTEERQRRGQIQLTRSKHLWED